MRSKSRSAALLTLSGVVLAILLWAWMGADETVPADSDKGSAAMVAENADSATADAESVTGGRLDPEPPGQALAATIAPAPETTSPSSGEAGTKESAEPLSAEQLIVLRDVESQLAAAFDGDQNEAVALAGFLNQCQFTFRDRSRVEQSISRAERSFAEGKPLTQFRPSSPAQQFDTLEDFQTSQWNSFFRCEAARTMINDDFWANLEQQADAGNPAARYLFATLNRNASSQVWAFENWDKELQHREQSREYTWRNLDEREPLGLLALVELEGLGLTMRGIGAGASTNTVLILAAVKCGLSTPELLQSVDQLLQNVERMEKSQPGALERLNTASDEARRMFCK